MRSKGGWWASFRRPNVPRRAGRAPVDGPVPPSLNKLAHAHSTGIAAWTIIFTMTRCIEVFLSRYLPTSKVGSYGVPGEYFANDFVIGNLIEKAGYRVVLSRHVIDHVVSPLTFRRVWEHQVKESEVQK